MSLFESPEYRQDQAFGGTKYAGLKLLQRLGVNTLDNIFSPGFEVYDQLMAGELGQWMQQAYVQRDVIMQAYEQHLQGEKCDTNTVHKAFQFFNVRSFSAKQLGESFTDKARLYVTRQESLVQRISEFIQSDESYLYRSSADIEDEEANTAGLFHTVINPFPNERKEEEIVDNLALFFGHNLAISLFQRRPARLNVVICGAINSEAGGIGLSYMPSGDYYFEIAENPIAICQDGKTFMTIIQGTHSHFTVSKVNKNNQLKHLVQGVPSYASEAQIRVGLSTLEKIEAAVGSPLHIELLWKKDSIEPTVLQVRKYISQVADQQISDDNFTAADFATVVGIKPGAVTVPVFNVPYVTYLKDELQMIDESATLNALRTLNRENPKGYALLDEDRLTMNSMSVPLGDFYVEEPTIDFLRRMCTNVKVFISNYEFSSRGGHGRLNMASDNSNQFYLSIPGFKVSDGAIAQIRSDGYRGIVNLLK